MSFWGNVVVSSSFVWTPVAKEKRRGRVARRRCRHCGAAPVCRPRRLCWTCYYTPGVRALYPPTSKYARFGLGLRPRRRLLPPYPTKALPGSPEKIAVLTERARRGLELFHPDDAPLQRTGVRLSRVG
jgi:hypothetical protein